MNNSDFSPSVPVSLAIMAVLAVFPMALCHGQEELTVVKFDKPLDEMTNATSQFGVFRDDKQPPEVQFIQEEFVREKLPDGTEMGFLRLTYVLGPGTYNGWWLKPRSPENPEKEADWSDYRRGALILRLRKGNPCTNVFKCEIKTNGGDNVHPAYVRLGSRHQKVMDKKGYADLILPFGAFVGSGESLTRVSEVVLVLEENRVTERRGNLLIHSIRLVKSVPRP